MQSDPETDRPVAAIVKLTAPTVGARIDAVLMAEDAVAQESDSEEVEMPFTKTYKEHQVYF